MKKTLLVGNVIYIPVECGQYPNKHFMYLGGSITGYCFVNQLYTEQQVRTMHPDIKEVEEGFLGINEAYFGKPRAIKNMF